MDRDYPVRDRLTVSPITAAVTGPRGVALRSRGRSDASAIRAVLDVLQVASLPILELWPDWPSRLA
jgi:hypothetical protein